jgi:hypothetical protein
MGILHLIIKGNRKQALAAAKDHGITLFSAIPNRRNKDETNAMCGDEYKDAVVSWYASETRLVAPFPVGTLLLWSEQQSVYPYAPITEGATK